MLLALGWTLTQLDLLYEVLETEYSTLTLPSPCSQDGFGVM
jgi:hypothetical protein